MIIDPWRFLSFFLAGRPCDFVQFYRISSGSWCSFKMWSPNLELLYEDKHGSSVDSIIDSWRFISFSKVLAGAAVSPARGRVSSILHT
jgi:hypothetical protein